MIGNRCLWLAPALVAVALDAPTGPARGADVTVRDRATLLQALQAARPGTRILLAPGTYEGGIYFRGLRGSAQQPIVIASADPKRPAVIRGGGNNIHLSDPAYVEIRDLVFVGGTGNGLNIDDAGSFDTPAHHITLRNLQVRDVGPEGNRDGIKLSGVTDFLVQGCAIERWGSGGSGLDMVGCHRGIVEGSTFRHGDSVGANGVQAKGGSAEITVRRCRFESAGQRAVQAGGSTGLDYFRPHGQRHHEARAIRVEGNTFLGAQATVAFVGVDGAVFRFNTIYRPKRWVLRILQETVGPEFVPCRNGVFTDNVVVWRSQELVETVNIGPNTAPHTFQFARNVWYCEDRPERSRPTLPAPETGGTVGHDPLFRDAVSGDLRLKPGSPAAGKGSEGLRP